MRNLSTLGSTLVTLPLVDPGDSQRAAPPFELPYTLDLPNREVDRWRRHLDVLDDADSLIMLIMKNYPEDATNDDLKHLLSDDARTRNFMTPLGKPSTTPGPAGGPFPAPGGPNPATGGTSSGGGAGGSPVAGSVHWPRVKQILDGAITGWTAKHNRAPLLKKRHGASFAWDTKAELAAAVAMISGTAYRLIDPSLVGNGQGRKTYLVVALSDANGVDGNGQMPNDGPYLSDASIGEIVRWIDDGMPD